MSTWIVILLPAVLLQGAAAQVQQLPAILESVSKNVKETRDSLPDFLCSEKVTSTTFESGRQRDQKIVESIYSIGQSREQREILTVDGKPAKKGAKMPGLPVNILGSFNYMITATFAPEMLRWYDFEQKAEEAGRLVVQFETKPEQRKMIWNINGDQNVAHDTGTAWIDPEAMQVLRNERNLRNIGNMTAWRITIDQAPVTLGDRKFWLPKSFLTEVTYKDPRRRGTFLAEYSDCKKFTTDVTIRPQTGTH
jgi:hypothetical protein